MSIEETADVYIYVGARFFPFFLAVDLIRNILSKFCFRSRKKEAFTLSSLKITVVWRCSMIWETGFFLFPGEGSLISLERLNIKSKISPEKNHLIT